MASKLTEITTKYHTFVDNQVLTKDQLNEFVTYFDDQNRLTRVFLYGVGIVCGFKLSLNASSITITPGVGVTTDGDLLQMKVSIPGSDLKTLASEPVKYSYYKSFADDVANYNQFRKQVGGESQVMDLWELFPEQLEDTQPLHTIPDLNNKVVLLYLESFAREDELCTTIDCDNQGVEQINRLKVLLVSKTDADLIAKRDTVFSAFNVFNHYFNLPEIAIRRVVLNQINTVKYEELKRTYYNVINSDNLVKHLSNGITRIIQNFESILQLNISTTILNTSITKLKSIFNFSAYAVPFDIQYRYDFLKNIIDTYSEIKTLLLDLKGICLPDINAFPKHLMLGLISEVNIQPKQLRHSFYKSPAISCGLDKLLLCKSLINRLFVLIDTYGVKSGDIKIIPSNRLKDLGQQAIPYYYKHNDVLVRSWSFHKTSKGDEKYNLGYHTDNLAAAPHIQNPLAYNIDKYDFLRIEGHQGKDYRDALETLNDLKVKYGLAFDVKALAVNLTDETLDIDDYECEFEDLKVMLNAWKAEQDCILAQVASFFSSFSTAEPGKNMKESELVLTNKASARLASVYSGDLKSATAGKDISYLNVNTLYQRVYTVNSVVTDNMNTAKDTLGIEMKAAIEENKAGSVNDIIASASQKLAEKVNTDEWNADPGLKFFVVEKGVELMAYTHVITQRMPAEVAVVDTIKVNDYKITLVQLCDLVQKMKAAYQSLQLSVALRAFMGLLINQLSTVCCSGKKLEILLEEINKRKEKILLELQLSKFIENHPGAEHVAGVVPGGTFIIVYKNKEVLQRPELSVNDLSSSNAFNNATAELANDLLKINKYSASERNIVLNRVSDLLKLEDSLANRLESLSAFVKVSDIPDNTVVADFALPYLCCSECKPINYIVAKPPATLRLEKDKYCLGTDTDPVLFEISPADGVVKSDPETEAITIQDNSLVIIPALFPEELIGQEIRFTVNDQVTDAVLTVYKGIQVDFNVPESPTSQTTFTFVATGNVQGVKFFWAFGDGTTSEDRSPTHTYNLPVGEDNKVVVSLTATAENGICTSSVEHGIEFVAIPASIDLEEKEYCENDKSTYPFNVTPAGADVEIAGPGVSKNAAGNFVFNPTSAGAGTHSFMLDGEASDLTIVVQAAPFASFTAQQVGNQLILTNTSLNANQFIWTINGQEFERGDANPYIINLTPDSPTSWVISLQARGAAVCPPHRSRTTTVNTKYNNEPEENCIDETKADILIDHTALHAIKHDDNGVVDEFWKQTAVVYGGTSDFNEGVTDAIDQFLEGEANDRLDGMFTLLLRRTTEMILEMSGQEDVVPRLVQLFELQLRLFYNVLGCQDNDAIFKHADVLKNMLEQILELLRLLQNQQVVVFSDTMKSFIADYLKKISDVEMLKDHVERIIAGNLI
ncbi:hypothetical protein [Saccharicrinis sp. 156]|uniref:hypothetical protein n=1 Tax=Saccharicrinis sp. 156 TaxID=3417574 RepID=UPI003D334DC4